MSGSSAETVIVESSRMPQNTPRRATWSKRILGLEQPRARVGDLEAVERGEQDKLWVRVTKQEALYGVIITMGIAGMRDQVLSDHDVEWYILHFFCFYAPVSASIQYSNRFNDDDFFHRCLWVGFLVGMVGQVMFLDHSLPGFACSTSFNYILIFLANARVAFDLPRPRLLCCCFCAQCLCAAGLFISLAIWGCQGESHQNQPVSWERIALWFHIFIEALFTCIFVAITTEPNRRRQYDFPLNIEYMISRFDGLKMMSIVCSFLFPIGLQGSFFAQSRTAALALFFANTHAVLLKLALFDVGASLRKELHAIRRSRTSAVCFLLTFPLLLLGIALTGVGYLAAIREATPDLSRPALCAGAALASGMVAFTQLMHATQEPKLHYSTVLASALCAVAFLVPALLQFDLIPMLAYTVCIQFLVVGIPLFLYFCFKGELPTSWQWNAPCYYKDRIDDVATENANIHSQEVFFTVLVAVCVFKINEDVRESHDLEIWLLRYFILFGVLKASMRYASRFNDDDLAHKIVWSLFQTGLLFMLVGLGEPGGGAGLWSLYKLATVAIFLLLCLGFSARMAMSLPKVRGFTATFASIHAFCAVLMWSTCWTSTHLRPILWIICLVTQYAEAAYAVVTSYIRVSPRGPWYVDFNVHYVIHRHDELFMEVIGVALIVPIAMYPGDVSKPRAMVVAILLAVSLTVLLKIAYFDIEPRDWRRHAAHRANWSKIAFLNLAPILLLGLVGIGAAVPILITSAGQGKKIESNDGRFAQRLLCVSAWVTLTSLAASKLLHKPSFLPTIHGAKVFVTMLGGGFTLLVMSFELDDLSVLAAVVAIKAAVVATCYIMNFCPSSIDDDVNFLEESLLA